MGPFPQDSTMQCSVVQWIWRVNTKFVGFIPQSLVLRSIVYWSIDLIWFSYQNILTQSHRRQNVVTTLFCCYHILTSSVIY